MAIESQNWMFKAKISVDHSINTSSAYCVCMCCRLRMKTCQVMGMYSDKGFFQLRWCCCSSIPSKYLFSTYISVQSQGNGSVVSVCHVRMRKVVQISSINYNNNKKSQALCRQRKADSENHWPDILAGSMTSMFSEGTVRKTQQKKTLHIKLCCLPIHTCIHITACTSVFTHELVCIQVHKHTHPQIWGGSFPGFASFIILVIYHQVRLM